MTGFVMYAGVRLIRSRGDSAFWAATFSLAGFALLFAAGTAAGRVCLEFTSANASRYIPYMLPGMLGLYLVIRRSAAKSPVAMRTASVFLVACVAKETGRPAKVRRRRASSTSNDGATAIWPRTISAHATRQPGIRCTPSPEVTHLQKKLDWLEQHHYSLFRDRPARTD